MSNAIKFTDQGEIAVKVDILEEDAQTAHLGISVADTGIGISSEAMNRIFAPFEQADSSTTRQHGGTGLGLSICKHLVELMGGKISVTSTTGIGSTFSFTLRLEKAAASLPERDHGKSTEQENLLRERHHGKRILLAEDDEINQEVARDLLEVGGQLNITVASDGLEAVALAGAANFDLILLDIQMPNMDGLDACRAIRALPGHASTPIIAMTANAFSEDRQRCLESGMDDFIAKPVDPEALFTLLNRWLDKNPKQSAG